MVRFVSAHPEVELLVGGTHPRNGDLMQFFKARTGMTMLQWRRRGGSSA